MTQLKLGKKPATYDRRDLLYADVRPKGLNLRLPNSWGRGLDFTNWLMLGNGPCDDNSITDQSWAAYQGAGDCAWAGPAHETMQAAHDAGEAVPKFTCLNVLEQYSAYSGYDLQSGSNDNGSNVRDVLSWRQSKGLADVDGNVYKIGTFVQLEIGNWQHLQEASWLFQSVGLGFNFPDSAMDQFNNGQAWSVVSGAQIDGGHYVPIAGPPGPGYWTCITWAKRQVMTAQFLGNYADELWAYIDPERYTQVTGLTYNSYADADLEKYLQMLAAAYSGS